MSELSLSDAELIDRLNAHPHLRRRMESILSEVENEAGDLQLADAAELRVIEEMRQLGRETLTAWAQRQLSKTTASLDEQRGIGRSGKKNFAGTPHSATLK